MKNCKKRFSHRALALLAVVLMLAITLVSFTSCGGSSKYNEITESEKENPKYFVSRILSSNETARVRFIAASRGHDITQEDFVDTDEVFDVNLNAAKAVLEDIIKQDNFATAEDKAIFTSYTENLTKEDVSEIAKLAKSTVALQADNGIFTYILIGIGKALGWLTRLLGDYYVIAILVFAIFVEIIMLPMSIKQQKNSIGMAKLRPKIAKIEKKYAGRYDQATVRKKQEESEPQKLGIVALLVQGVATSIDALSVGFTIADYNLFEALICVLLIAFVTLIICALGVATSGPSPCAY